MRSINELQFLIAPVSLRLASDVSENLAMRKAGQDKTVILISHFRVSRLSSFSVFSVIGGRFGDMKLVRLASPALRLPIYDTLRVCALNGSESFGQCMHIVTAVACQTILDPPKLVNNWISHYLHLRKVHMENYQSHVVLWFATLTTSWLGRAVR
jgi:hypothetical protein